MNWSEAYQHGYEQGILIGELRAGLRITKALMESFKLDSYEVCFQLIKLNDEGAIARLMDYLPIRGYEWRFMRKEEIDIVIERVKATMQEEGKGNK